MTTSAVRKKPAPQDWHPADIVAALRKAGWSLVQLAVANGYKSRTAIAHAMHRPYPKAERIIASALDMQPQDVWPTRYNADGTSNRTPGSKPLRPAHFTVVPKATTPGSGRNPQKPAGG
ncbi:helix-turn-helix domain-containing protein [Dyella terrae]|uniref:helix-turn-helix domain-containing protein n=1 Tax=Dyella terrae TaxID=522259 RepID=UPI001EFDF6EC|nr:helix-turn-helix transcriptional regulator [Dyella terrae]ULU26631.1 helix-turn-helix domain-containing protein [Dyella terrae]